MSKRKASILQLDNARCYLCGGFAEPFDPLDVHHVFGGALRGKSGGYGLTVLLHHNKCHIFGGNSVHVNARVDKALKAEAQKQAMAAYGWSVEDFREEFYKNYLEGAESEG
jgi:hypothetical protein